MQAFTSLQSVVIPLDRSNVDTDAIIPKQYLKSIKRSGFGPNLFDDWRYLDKGEPGQDSTGRRINSEFVLNRPEYQGAQILMARQNFGCGSSREHAVWALMDWGIRVVIASSFADIFHSNCFKNGLLPIVLSEEQIAQWFSACATDSSFALSVDLEKQIVTDPKNNTVHFEIDPFRRDCLLQGLDEIGLTMQQADEIRSYEERRLIEAPWLF